MLIFKEHIKEKFNYPLEQKVNLDRTIYFDIETTGLSRKYCSIYLIGAMYYENGQPVIIQWFAENYNDEANVLMAFHRFIAKFDTIIQFNGNSFDIPFVKERGEKYKIDFDFDRFSQLDLYYSLKQLKTLLGLDSLKQKSFEKFLRIKRQDQFGGGELIDVYKEYVKTKNEKLLFPLLLHNYEDVEYMGFLTELLSYKDLLEGGFIIDTFSINQYVDYEGNERQELSMIIRNKLPIPIETIYTDKNIYCKITEDITVIKVQAIEDTLKLFYPNYKDYYYLPKEDKAVHKSLGQFVQRPYREQAKASNCYENISDLFLPLIGSMDYSYVFKKDYNSKDRFIRVKDLDRTNITEYVMGIWASLV